MITNKRFYNLFQYHKKYIDPAINGTSYNFLFPEQKEIIDVFQKEWKEGKSIINIKSAMGSGKTCSMLLIATMINEASLFVIPCKAFTTWIIEIKKMDFYKLTHNPEESNIIIYHNTYYKHREYFDILYENKKYLLTNFYYFQEYLRNLNNSNSNALSKWIKSKKPVVFLDEAHTMKTKINISNFKALVKFSASLYEKNMIEIDSKFNKLPICEFIYLNFDYINEIKNLNIKSGLIILPSQVELRKEHIRLKNLGINSFIFHNTSCKSLEKIKSDGFLLSTYRTCSEGVNFNMIENVILLDLETASGTRANQVIGRVKRRNNPHKKIKIFCVLPSDEILYIRTKIRVISLKLECDIFAKTAETIRYILDKFHEHNINYKNLTDTEIVLIFGITRGYQKMKMDFSLPLEILLSYVSIG
ncbi:MAG: DEAD/DEAH box helicase family protein [Nitrososphaerota archaeon]